jgi:hypothetical protein
MRSPWASPSDPRKAEADIDRVFPRGLTWTCHVCKEERPDDRISVYTTSKRTELGVEIKQNVRYCNDNPACLEGAKEIDWLRGADDD